MSKKKKPTPQQQAFKDMGYNASRFVREEKLICQLYKTQKIINITT